jgi:hypothetical protein
VQLDTNQFRQRLPVPRMRFGAGPPLRVRHKAWQRGEPAPTAILIPDMMAVGLLVVAEGTSFTLIYLNSNTNTCPNFPGPSSTGGLRANPLSRNFVRISFMESVSPGSAYVTRHP